MPASVGIHASWEHARLGAERTLPKGRLLEEADGEAHHRSASVGGLRRTAEAVVHLAQVFAVNVVHRVVQRLVQNGIAVPVTLLGAKCGARAGERRPSGKRRQLQRRAGRDEERAEYEPADHSGCSAWCWSLCRGLRSLFLRPPRALMCSWRASFRSPGGSLKVPSLLAALGRPRPAAAGRGRLWEVVTISVFTKPVNHLQVSKLRRVLE